MRFGHGDVKGWRRAVLGAAALLLGAASPADAATMIRDAEIEETIARIADPIFEAARLDREAIDVYLLRDDKLNAFVAGGQNLFLNTGLLIRSESADQLAGVIAHETGHIAGGHLSRAVAARERATVESLLGAVLGVVAAAAGAPQVGTAILAGGATVAQRGVLSFSRTQEQAADQAAVGLLAATGRSPEGLLGFMQILDGQNLRLAADGNPFLRSHPLTRDRVAFLEQQAKASPYPAEAPDRGLAEAHARMVAKLDGFLAEPNAALRRHQGDGLPARYARAVAHYRLSQVDKALALLDQLSAERPTDPWFRELRGQILFESGKLAEAEAPYREALRLRPGSALMRLGLARTLMERGGDARLAEAAALLKEVVRVEPRNAGAWRFLGVAQGQLGAEDEAALSLTEHSVLAGRKDDAELHLRRAQAAIEPADPGWVRVQDLTRAVAEMREDEPPPPPRGARPQRRF